MKVAEGLRLVDGCSAFLFVLVLTACGSDKSPSSNSNPTAPTTPTAQPVKLAALSSLQQQVFVAGAHAPEGLTVVATRGSAPLAGVAIRWTQRVAGNIVDLGTTTTDVGGTSTLDGRVQPVPGAQLFVATLDSAVVQFTVTLQATQWRFLPSELWKGDTVTASIAAYDANGVSLQTASDTLSVGANSPINFISAGRVAATGTGRATVQIRSGGVLASVAVSVYTRVRFAVESLDSSSVSGVRAFVRDSTSLDSADVAPGGTAEIRTHSFGTAFEAWIDEGARPTRRFFPSYRSTLTTGASAARVVLVPQRWTVRGGVYDGASFLMSLNAAYSIDNDAFGSRAYFETNSSGWAGDPSSPSHLAAVDPRRLPLRGALHHTSDAATNPTAADSIGMWRALGRLNALLGLSLFAPANESDLTMIPVSGNTQVRVPVDAVVFRKDASGLEQIGALGSGGTGAAGLCSWQGSDCRFVTDVRSGGVTLVPQCLAGCDGVVMHEALHSIGFGHTCYWTSVMTYPSANDCTLRHIGAFAADQASEMTSYDVAFFKLHLSMATRIRQLGFVPDFAIWEALQGERVRMLFVAPAMAVRLVSQKEAVVGKERP